MKAQILALIFMVWAPIALANPCIDKFKDLVPALKDAAFKETGKGEKDYWKVPGTERDEKLFRSNIYAQLSGEPWGAGDRNSIISIAKSEGPKGENTLYRKRDNSAVLIAGLGQSGPMVIHFDNVSCKVTSVRFYDMRTTKFIAEDYQRSAYVDAEFCEFIEKHRGSLARLPKDFGTYECEELNCGVMNRTTGYCMCNNADGKSRPMTKPCCAGGVPRKNLLEKIQEEYNQLENKKIDWEELSAELISKSNTQCKKWKSHFAGTADVRGKVTAPVSR